MVLSMAPWGFWPAMIAGFGGFYFLMTKMKTRRAVFAAGWLFGFGYFSCGLWWIANALLVPGNPFSWVWPLAIAGLPAMLAFFPALAAYVAARFSDLKTIPGFLLFIALMGISEWLRGHVFTGFPWNLYGYAWNGWAAMMQNDAWAGPYMLTLLTVFWAALPGFLFSWGVSAKNRIVLAAAALLVFSLCAGFGYGRLAGAGNESQENVEVLIVQPDIPQEEKWDNAKAVDNLLTLSTLSASQKDAPGKTTIILWPETAILAGALTHPNALAILKPAFDSYSGPAWLLTGMLRSETNGGGERYFNSIAAVGRDIAVSAMYDKSHLVPFGEYIPLQKYIPLAPFVRFEGFTSGGGPQTLTLPGLPPVSPLVCYEIIFPGKAARRGADRPAFIFNATNDAWYGDSPGPRQHFMQARFRAIEEGLPVVRSANTGISGLIDPYGRPLLTIGIDSRGAERISLPKPLAHAPLYTVTGDWIFLAAVLTLIFPSRKRRS